MNMKGEIQLSILVMTYNHEEFIKDMISSLLDIEIESCELIVGDDCSSDSTWEILQEWKNELEKVFSNVILLKNETNLGITRNINNMLSYANGKYIKLIAGDDFFVSGGAERAFSYLKQNERIDVLVCNGFRVSERSHYNSLIEMKEFWNADKCFTEDDYSIESLFDDNIIFAPGVFVKHDVYNKIGLYNEMLCFEDWEFWLRAAASGTINISYCNEMVAYYRINENSMTSQSGNREKLDQRKAKYLKDVFEIYDMYRTNVDRKTYNKIVGNRIIAEMSFARQEKMVRTRKLLASKMKKYFNDNDISLKMKMLLLAKYIKHVLLLVE